MAALTGATTADNKFYALRRDHFVGSRARVSAAQDRGQSTSVTLYLCFAASRSDHILTCCEDPASQNVSVKSTLYDMAKRYMRKLILIALGTCFCTGIYAEPRINAILKAMNIREEGECNKRNFTPLSLGDQKVPRDKLITFYSALHDSTDLDAFVLKEFGGEIRDEESKVLAGFLALLENPIIAKVLQQDRTIIARCNRDHYKGFYAKLSPKRQEALADVYYSMRNHIFLRESYYLLQPYMARLAAYFMADFTKNKIPIDVLEKRSKTSSMLWVMRSQEAEAKRIIPSEEQDRFSYLHSVLTNAELSEINVLYSLADFRKVHDKIRQAILASKKRNLKRFFPS